MPRAVEVNLTFAFRNLDLQPISLSHSMEHMTAHDMVSNEAKWNKSCYNKFGMNTFDRAKRKRKQADIKLTLVTSAVPNEFGQGVSLWIKIYADASGRPHQFSALQSDTSVRSMAKDLQDASLLARIKGGYLIALEAKYHLSCLATFRNHQRSHIKEIHCASEVSLENKIMEALTFVELVIYIEFSRGRKVLF